MIKDLVYLRKMMITVLVEDSIAFDTPYVGRFGLALPKELNAGSCEKKILFDTNSAAASIFYSL
jgi:metal-dependent hydrolase (beta-lactamase superfamily II)